jgi:hypothetical protein
MQNKILARTLLRPSSVLSSSRPPNLERSESRDLFFVMPVNIHVIVQYISHIIETPSTLNLVANDSNYTNQ